MENLNGYFLSDKLLFLLLFFYKIKYLFLYFILLTWGLGNGDRGMGIRE